MAAIPILKLRQASMEPRPATKPASKPRGASRGDEKSRGKLRVPIVKATDDTRLRTAIDALHNNAIEKVETKGSLSETSTTFPAEVLAMAKSMFPANKSYSFEIHANFTVQSTGGGVLQFIADWNPSTTTFLEWAALAALFDEVKLQKSRIDFTSAFGPVEAAAKIWVQFVIAPEITTSLATSYNPIQRLAESEVFHCVWMSKNGAKFTKIHRIKDTDRDWASTLTPGGASGMVAGCIGRWTVASNIVGTVSQNYLFWAMKNTVKLRSRA